MSQAIKLLRVSQYVKNGFIFLPFFFSIQTLSVNIIQQLIIAFIGFSSIASMVYVINDVIDADLDKLHPKKKNRPIAAGTISKTRALIIALILGCIGTSISLYQDTLLYTYAYISLNLLYSFKVKHIPILDVITIALGFILRLMIGAHVSLVSLSMWIIIMTFLLTLFLAFSKRSGDLFNLQNAQTRPVLAKYDQSFLNISIAIMGSVTIVAYLMYTTSADVIERAGSNQLYITGIFVLYGILRYLKITFFDHKSDNPTDVLIKDSGLQLTIIGWLISFTVILYL
jgi:decaprenyl-phosphate phosphoribosyltransferase